jgi:hypothetical protein
MSYIIHYLLILSNQNPKTTIPENDVSKIIQLNDSKFISATETWIRTHLNRPIVVRIPDG